jgi:hypothetical protein
MRGVTIAVTLALGVRLVVAALAWAVGGNGAFLSRDSDPYLALAGALAMDFRFYSGGLPEIFRTPGYPALLVPGVWLGHPVAWALGVQFAFSAAIVVLTARIARRLGFAGPVITGCAVAVGIDPTLLHWSVKVMSDVACAALVLVFVWCALRFLERPSVRGAILTGIAVGLCSFVRPIAYFLPLWVAGAAAAWRCLAPRRSLVSWTQIAVFLMSSAVLLGSWQIRNGLLTGYYGFSTVVERALYLGAGASLVAARENRPYYEVRGRFLAERRAPPEMRRRGLALILSDPATWGGRHAAGMLRTIADPGAVEYLRTFGLYPELGGRLGQVIDRGIVPVIRDIYWEQPLVFWATLLSGPFVLPLLFLPVVAALRGPQPRHAFIMIAVLAAYFVIASGGYPGSSRLRVPAVPLMVLMCGFAFGRRGDPPAATYRLRTPSSFSGHASCTSDGGRAADRQFSTPDT